MNPLEIIAGIKDYTSSDYKVNIDTVIVARGFIEDVTGYILGLMAFFIVVGMAIITALDVCYISIPAFRIMVKNSRWDGTTSVKFRVISKDAVNAVEYGSLENGMIPLQIYLKSRIKTYIICAILLYVIIAGSNTIIPFIAEVVSGIVSVINNLHLLA